MVFKFDAGDLGTKTLCRKLGQENRKEHKTSKNQR